MSNAGGATVINDRYEIHKRVGRGGMADVFLARDRLLDRQVAIKVLFPEFAVDPNFVERFRREAQAAANLSHPNIVSVYDWGKYEGTYFIAMEYVHGRTLAEILKTNTRLTPKQGAEIASEVAAALGFAHEGGLAHRDIKPANILIGSNGQVKVADFGIARAMNSATESNLTQAGSVMGTASYFSPEQAQGAQPDPRSDLYSLGIVMYEMIAGRAPFTGENPVAIAYKQVHDQPTPLNKLVDGVPRAFEAIVAKLLAKDPKLRYPSAHALRDDLRRFRNGEQVQALVTAAARPGTPAAGTPRPVAPTQATPGVPGRTPSAPVTTVVAGTSPALDAYRSAGPTTAHPQIAGAPTTALPARGTADMSHYPPGASPEARYYQDGNSRTGWYALAAFIALVALAAGGVLLYQGLTKQGEQTSEGVTLDNYVGRPITEAVQELQGLGLEPLAIPVANPLVGEEIIHEMRINGAPAEVGVIVPINTPIELIFNPTQTLVTVPSVENLDLATAQARLTESGFQHRFESEENEEVAEGHVIRTDPAAGQSVRQDTIITIIVSGGPGTVFVPADIINTPAASAQARLRSSEFGLEVTIRYQPDDNIAAEIVIATDPPVNTRVERGQLVTLIVSSGPGESQVPPLIGQTEASARNTLNARNLGIHVTYDEVPPGHPSDGTVTEQHPLQGTMVAKGTVVNVVIAQATAAVTTTLPPTTTTTTVPPTTQPPTTTTTTTTTVPPEAPTTPPPGTTPSP
ncbi:MAG TPA: Stk1 family PASTA domain-containing Ser/Thr kinase [Ilumatobacter sp.]|nr:Stk1 family PASTA domain-containing Ser/Thr kinase [Ilumatobacter sp.]